MKEENKIKDTFVSKAAEWDSPDKVAMTNKFVNELLSHIHPLPSWKALEIGTGTGLVGLQIEPLVGMLVMEDTSESMLNVLRQKLNSESKVEIVHGEVFDYQERDIDFVFSAMAFHHLPDVKKTIHHLATITKTDAYVAIGDLVTEDGSFHRFEPIPHCGFDTVLLSQQFEQAGFKVIRVKVYNTLSRLMDGEMRSYDQFMLIAQRKENE
ncbi:MAG: class I SAM-dependent methyltransferase [Bacteroidales bacterium]|nr:class I SAM-dependent methyltransferase [Bacteroidales bacterium]